MTTAATSAAHAALAERVAKAEVRLDAHKSAASQLREEFDSFQKEVRKDFEALRMDATEIKTLIQSNDRRAERGAKMWLQLIASLAAIVCAVIAMLK